MSDYDPIAWLYDPWSTSVVEDISFYVEEALQAAARPVVELGVGTGRIAIPTALAGVHVIGVDASAGMLEVAAARALDAGVADRLDLRRGDLRRPPVDERVLLVTCPFRAFLHLPTDVVERAFVGTEVILAAGKQVAALPRLRTVQRQFDREQSSLRVA